MPRSVAIIISDATTLAHEIDRGGLPRASSGSGTRRASPGLASAGFRVVPHFPQKMSSRATALPQ